MSADELEVIGVARACADYALIRVRPELFEQFIVFRLADRRRLFGAKWKPNVKTVKEWVGHYDIEYNGAGEKV